MGLPPYSAKTARTFRWRASGLRPYVRQPANGMFSVGVCKEPLRKGTVYVRFLFAVCQANSRLVECDFFERISLACGEIPAGP